MAGGFLMKRKKRFKLPRRRSRRMFSKSGNRTHHKNIDARPMRGGIRL